MTLPTNALKLSALFAAAFLGPVLVNAQAMTDKNTNPSREVAGTFNYVHTNAPPGGCGCFSMYGGGGSGAVYSGPHFALVADISFVHRDNVDNTSKALTFTSYLFGARIPVPLHHARIVPFGQALIGVTRESGSFAQVSATGFQNSTQVSGALGGGLDYRLTPRLTLRAVQAEYLITAFPNGLNSRQNNLRLQTGLAVRF